MSIKGIAASKTIKKGNTFLMPVALFITLKVVQSFTILALGKLSDETGRFNETLTALFTWHDSKEANINATHVKTILSVVCK